MIIKSISKFLNFYQEILIFRIKYPFVGMGIPFYWNTLGDVNKIWSKGYIYIHEGFFKRGVSFNKQSVFFIFFVTRIARAVIAFSIFYIPIHELSVFSFLIYHFIILIIILTRRTNMLSTFLGWEGVGVLSFILIGWFSSREEAVIGAKKAVLFNRLTDFFFLIIVFFEIGELCFFFSGGVTIYNNSLTTNYIFILFSLSFFFCCYGKSAQFMFHPWLTAAMEGPTPVRSLLHRRTIVVAGVWLLLHIYPFLYSGRWDFTIFFILRICRGTILRSSIWALSQTDLKKIVALSTTSQLRFMMILILLGYPDLRYFHLLFHGYFKALIFMGRGVRIHSNINRRQDVRKISGSNNNPYLIIFFFLGNIGLMGIPFFGGFWSKHIILDIFNNPFIIDYSFLFYFILILSSSLTIAYSLKRIKVFLGNSSIISFSPEKKFLTREILGEIYPTSLLRIFVLFFAPLFLFFFTTFERFHLKLEMQKFDLVFLISLGLLFFNRVNPNSFGLKFFIRSQFVLLLRRKIKFFFKFFQGIIIERLILKIFFKKIFLKSYWRKSNFKSNSFINLESEVSTKWNINLVIFIFIFLIILILFF